MTHSIRRATRDDLPAIIALQHAAYAQNRALLGAEPLPLQADYDTVLATMECWVAVDDDIIGGCLFLDLRPDDLLIWSIATHPGTRSRGLGKSLLAFADARAVQSGRARVRLYTGELLKDNVAWYTRNGFAIERFEDMPDRRLVHMKKDMKSLGGST